MAAIELDRLTKVYADGTRAVHELDLDDRRRRVRRLRRPVRLRQDERAADDRRASRTSPTGTVRVGGEVVNDLPPKARDMAMIFQNYALYPHMNVYDNMAFGLKMRGIDKAEIRRRVEDAARVLGLAEVLTKRPRHLSGGQRQRVAMGRAIVREPQAFLMDEPLSNLDAKLRVQMRAEIARIQRDLERDDDLRHARPERGDDARRPRLRDARRAAPAGRPAAGALRPAREPLRRRVHRLARDEPRRGGARRARRRARRALRPARARRPGGRRARPRRAARAGAVALGIRPGGHRRRRRRRAPTLEVTVDIKEDMGAEVFLHFAVDAPPVNADELREIVGDEALEAAEEQTHHHGSPFVARVERGDAGARGGEGAQLAVDTSRLHFFDLETGRASPVRPSGSSPSADAERAADRGAGAAAHVGVRAAHVEEDRERPQLARRHGDRPAGEMKMRRLAVVLRTSNWT